MGYILIQHDNCSESLRALKLVEDSGDFTFELSLEGPRLHPVLFGSRSDLPYEMNYHSFVGEIACGRWSITHNRRYLWGKKFYWIYDCNSVKEILEYTSSIYQLRRWSQELFAYDFNIIHRPSPMMKDVDTLLRHPNLPIGQYLATACVMRSRDIRSRPFAYNYDVFHRCSNPRHVKDSSRVLVSTSPSTFTPAIIHHFSLQFLQSLSFLHLPTNSIPTYNVFISPEQCTWLSFDSIIPSFNSLLHSSPTRTLHHFAFETNTIHYRIASFLSSHSTLYYTTLQHFYYHLLRLSHSSLHHISHAITSQQSSAVRSHYPYHRNTLDCSSLSTVSYCSTIVSDLSNYSDITMHVLLATCNTVPDRHVITTTVADIPHSLKLKQLKLKLNTALSAQNMKFVLPD